MGLAPLQASALTPIHAFFDLVAGRGEPGYEDGTFTDASFNNPLGLALNGDGTRLYVADRSNHRIRMVLLDQGNAVTTLAGSGDAVDQDGPLSTAAFNDPCYLAWLPSNQLAVYEDEGASLRLVDLNQGKVTTLLRPGLPELKGKSLKGCQGMVSNPETNILYLTDSEPQALWEVDLTGNRMALTEFTTSLPLASPSGLCFYRGKLCVADRQTSIVYQVDFPNPIPQTKVLPVSVLAQGTNIKALAVSGDNLYALQDSDKPFLCLSQGRIVDSPMVWDNPVHWGSGSNLVKPADWFTPASTLSLIPDDPRHLGRFFLSISSRNEVISFRDVGYRSNPQENPDCLAGLLPFGHLEAKHPGTFRILIVADPKLAIPVPMNFLTSPLADIPSAPSPFPTTAYSTASSIASPIFSPTPDPMGEVDPVNFPNTGPFPFFSLAMRIELALNTQASLKDDAQSYEVLGFDPSKADPSLLPRFALKYGVDLVLVMESTSDQPLPPADWLNPVWAAWKTTSDLAPPMAVCFIPGLGAVAEGLVERDRTFWSQECQTAGIPLLDLTESWNALRVSYFPTGQVGDGARLNNKGLSLLGWLVARELKVHEFFPKDQTPFYGPSPGPIRQFLDLAAGEGSPGYRDGNFASSLLDGPGGMAFSSGGKHLFVADTINHRIRTVDLDHDNKVQTLAGTGEAVEKDGSFSEASFEKPNLVAAVPQGLVVYEAVSGNLRFLDLQAKKVSTWAVREKGKPLDKLRLAGVYNLCYSPANQSLYLTQPNRGLLERIALNHLSLTVDLKRNSRVLHPGALCLFHGSVCLADLQTPEVYKIGYQPYGDMALELIGSSNLVRAIAASPDRLYALGGAQPQWSRIFPPESNLSLSLFSASFQPVKYDFPSFVGDWKEEGSAPGLVSDPNDERRLFLSSAGRNQIFSLRDYDFSNYLPRDIATPDGFSDFNYPAAKSPGTYRLMILGDSHVFRNDNGTNHLENLAKQLEIFLNTEAALEGIQKRFQVLNLAMPNNDDNPPYYFPAFLAPVLAQKYDVDEVLLCLNAEAHDSNLAPFYQRPLDAQDVPIWKKDTEFLLKPLLDRLPGGKVGDFLQRHLKKDGAKSALDLNYKKLASDPQDRESLAYMFSRPILKLRKDLQELQTRSGQRVQLKLCYFASGPSGIPNGVEPYRSLWRSSAAQAGVSFGDLSDPFIALRPDYFPVAENFGSFHPTPEGYALRGMLLGEFLIHQKWIPFEPPPLDKMKPAFSPTPSTLEMKTR